jgi:hypothetical protein
LESSNDLGASAEFQLPNNTSSINLNYSFAACFLHIEDNLARLWMLFLEHPFIYGLGAWRADGNCATNFKQNIFDRMNLPSSENAGLVCDVTVVKGFFPA